MATPVAARQSLLEVRLLDDSGFVRLIASMGNDARIVQAARVSTGAGSKGPEADAKLIRYLMNNRHTSPFEKVVFEFHVKAPIFITRQWMRHRTGSFNEESGRYSELKPEWYIPDPEQICYQDKRNKQGRAAPVEEPIAVDFASELEDSSQECFELYREWLDKGIARETARLFLPVNTYTSFYWTVNLHNLLHFLSLRRDRHAQWEIRQYADAVYDLAKDVAPVAFAAWEERNQQEKQAAQEYANRRAPSPQPWHFRFYLLLVKAFGGKPYDC